MQCKLTSTIVGHTVSQRLGSMVLATSTQHQKLTMTEYNSGMLVIFESESDDYISLFSMLLAAQMSMQMHCNLSFETTIAACADRQRGHPKQIKPSQMYTRKIQDVHSHRNYIT